ncbi:MAG: hypothetical protein M3O28_09060 [Actinomycetota bacterium]|nr:hypothetical protein [Actinomycetota bacterium]
MMIAGLLVIALICLILGLVLPSSVWLVASLIATAGAAFLLWKGRTVIARPAESETEQERTTNILGEPIGTAAVAHSAGREPEIAATSAPTSSSTDVARTAAAAPPGEVWVIDGRPRYHLARCAIIQGQDAEPIPFDQAVEDGFMPCSLCEPSVAQLTP